MTERQLSKLKSYIDSVIVGTHLIMGMMEVTFLHETAFHASGLKEHSGMQSIN